MCRNIHHSFIIIFEILGPVIAPIQLYPDGSFLFRSVSGQPVLLYYILKQFVIFLNNYVYKSQFTSYERRLNLKYPKLFVWESMIFGPFFRANLILGKENEWASNFQQLGNQIAFQTAVKGRKGRNRPTAIYYYLHNKAISPGNLMALNYV